MILPIVSQALLKSVENLLGRWDISKGGLHEKEYRMMMQNGSAWTCHHIIGKPVDLHLRGRGSAADHRQHKERNTDTNPRYITCEFSKKAGCFPSIREWHSLFFRHRSFGEYLHALSGYKRHRLLPAERAFEPYWINIQFFQTGLFGDCEEHLNGLLSVIPRAKWAFTQNTGHARLLPRRLPDQIQRR